MIDCLFICCLVCAYGWRSQYVRAERMRITALQAVLSQICVRPKFKHPTYEISCIAPSGYIMMSAGDNVIWVHQDDVQNL